VSGLVLRAGDIAEDPLGCWLHDRSAVGVGASDGTKRSNMKSGAAAVSTGEDLVVEIRDVFDVDFVGLFFHSSSLIWRLPSERIALLHWLRVKFLAILAAAEPCW